MNNINIWLILPPIAFTLILISSILVSFISSKIAFKSQQDTYGKRKAYACGQDLPKHRLQPDYSQFFPFAFFFTIMHVVALIIATVPIKAFNSLGIAVLYFLAAFSSLLILFRKV